MYTFSSNGFTLHIKYVLDHVKVASTICVDARREFAKYPMYDEQINCCEVYNLLRRFQTRIILDKLIKKCIHLNKS
jgi:hypothetical protein